MASRLDTYNRADSSSSPGSPSDGGSAYVTSGSPGILSNRLHNYSGSTEANAALESSSTRVRVGANVYGNLCGPMVRYSGNANKIVLYYNSSTVIKCSVITGGSFSDVSYTGQTFVSGDLLELEVNGTAVNAYKNGSLLGSRTSSLNSSVTTHGAWIYPTGGDVDNLSVADQNPSLSAPATPLLTGTSGTLSVALSGTGTTWTAGTPGSPTFSLTSPPSGWSIASQVVNSATSATLTLDRGTGTGTITFSDGSLTCTATATATATAVATGNWSSASTWDTGIVPTAAAGNRSAIPAGFTVTVDANAAIGTSPSDTTTNVLTGTGTGSLTIADGVTFTVKGNVAIDNGVLQVGTGATGGAALEFDSSAAATSTIAGPTPAATGVATALGSFVASTTRYYVVTATTAAGESTPGAEASATTPGSGGPKFGISLSWPTVAGATGYKVYRSTASGGQGTSPALVATLPGWTTAWIDYGAAAATGSAPASNAAATGVRYQCVVGGNGKTSSRFATRGTASNRAVVRSVAGGNAQVTVTDGLYDVQDASFARMGDYASDSLAIGVVGATTGTHAFLRAVLGPACGRIHVTNNLPAGMGLTLDHVTHKSQGTGLTTAGSAASPTGPRRIRGCVFLGSTTTPATGLAIGGPDGGDEVLFLGSFPTDASFASKVTLFQNAFIRHTALPGADYNASSGWRMGDWDEVAIVCDVSDYDGNGRYTAKRSTRNAHWTTPAGGPNGTYAVTNSLCESFGMDSDDRTLDAADGDFDYGPQPGNISAFSKFLMIPQDRDSSSTPASPACTATNMQGVGSTYDHCTCYNGQQGFIALCESTDGTAGQIASCKSNIVWDEADQASGAFNAILYIDNPTYASNLATFPTADVVASGAADYNCFFNGNTARNYAGAPGYYYKRSAGATVPGAHDLVGIDPQFTDKTVRFWRWVKGLIGSNVIPAPASGGSPLTVASDSFMGGQTAGNASPPATGWRDYCAWGLYKLSLKNEPTHPDYDARFTLAAYKDYVRAGFAPRNVLLRNAGHDGVTIGAFDIPPEIDPAGIGTAEAEGNPSLSAGAVAASPGGIASGEAGGPPSLAPGAVAASPGGIATGEVPGPIDASPGAGSVAPGGIATGESTGSPSLTPGPIDASPGGIAPAEAPGSPTLSGPGTALPTGIPTGEAPGTPSASGNTSGGAGSVAPGGIATGEHVGTPSLSAPTPVHGLVGNWPRSIFPGSIFPRSIFPGPASPAPPEPEPPAVAGPDWMVLDDVVARLLATRAFEDAAWGANLELLFPESSYPAAAVEYVGTSENPVSDIDFMTNDGRYTLTIAVKGDDMRGRSAALRALAATARNALSGVSLAGICQPYFCRLREDGPAAATPPEARLRLVGSYRYTIEDDDSRDDSLD